MVCSRWRERRAMKRRDFIGATAVVGLWPLFARAQQTKPVRIGFVSWQAQSEDQLKYVREGLAQFGYVDGRNVSLEASFTDGDSERTRAVLRSLIDKPV